jgi:hypothetical protein
MKLLRCCLWTIFPPFFFSQVTEDLFKQKIYSWTVWVISLAICMVLCFMIERRCVDD